MAALFDLALLAGGIGGGRVWQYSRDRASMRVGRHLGRLQDAMHDMSSQRQRAEEQINHVTHRRR
jgi:hypothetical protein